MFLGFLGFRVEGPLLGLGVFMDALWFRASCIKSPRFCYFVEPDQASRCYGLGVEGFSSCAVGA